jgi:valyl-tRNA synthetase
MVAPIMPHVTEEIHSLFFGGIEDIESIHVSAWPDPSSGWDDPGAREAGALALAVVEGVRKVKSVHKVSVAAPVGVLRIACDEASWAKIAELETELRDVSNAQRVEYVERAGDDFVDTSIEGIKVSAELVEP